MNGSSIDSEMRLGHRIAILLLYGSGFIIIEYTNPRILSFSDWNLSDKQKGEMGLQNVLCLRLD